MFQDCKLCCGDLKGKCKMKYANIVDLVGNTPLVRLTPDLYKNVSLYAKLEGYNPSGSVKDRPAAYILQTALSSKSISKDTHIIESSSGNFAIALSLFAKKLGLTFTCVIDPHINPMNEFIIRSMGTQVIKVDKPDENGGYLLERIKTVKAYIKKHKNTYWVNQYANPLNAKAYYVTLAEELLQDLPKIDYVFIAVSSGGTITGVSQKIKEKSPKTKIIAVDVEGSVIFNHPPHKRHIPGMGSSMVPAILKNAHIDDVVMVDEVATIRSCNELLSTYSLFVGGSSGSVFTAVKKYLQQQKKSQPITAVMIFADRGERYQNTIYNPLWVQENFLNYN